MLQDNATENVLPPDPRTGMPRSSISPSSRTGQDSKVGEANNVHQQPQQFQPKISLSLLLHNILNMTPTPAQIRSLYQSLLTTSNRFASYNFKNYFVRRTNESFKPILKSLDSSTPVAGGIDLSQFYSDQCKELEVLRRAAEVNRLYEGPKLVVEHARPITSGGGAGMEASAGGGGQP